MFLRCVRRCSPLIRAVLCMIGRIWMRGMGVRVSRSCLIVGRPNLWNMEGSLSLGERVKLRSVGAAYSVGQSSPRCMFSAIPGGRITIGDDTVMYASVVSAASSISIGKRVLIAADCRIIDHDGHDVESFPRSPINTHQGEPIVIDDDVWLCADVTVCKGVTIGRGSVIGTKSVVTDDISPGVLAVGSPARVIRPLRVGEIRS